MANSGSLGGLGTYGYWWGATAYSSSNAYSISLSSSTVRAQDFISNLYGFTLRSTIARRYPLSYVFSGYYYWGDGNLYYQGFAGYWWSTAAYSDSNAYYLSTLSSFLNPHDNGTKAFGFALRSISRF